MTCVTGTVTARHGRFGDGFVVELADGTTVEARRFAGHYRGLTD